MFIYLATCSETGKYYVGQTINTVSFRWKQHVYSSKSYRCNTFLGRAIRKYGEDSFKLETLCECPDSESLNLAEKFFIYFLGSKKKSLGYNLTEGGDSLGSYSKELATKKNEQKLQEKKWLNYTQFKYDFKRKED
jgi:group I intron endonuclease